MNMMLPKVGVWLGLLLVPTLAMVTKVGEQSNQCGYAACAAAQIKPNMLNVHIVPHTHDDVGWLKTVDQYFYGARNDIQHAGVQYILDTVVQELLADPQRRFIYVEVAFFYRWWNQQTDALRNQTRALVNSGRLQFILGGWCMNDEATTHYMAIIDQHTRGLKFLKDNFGECGRPLVAWQIDPFGHSKEQASLFAQMGYDGLFFARLDYEEKQQRMAEKTLEMVWRGSEILRGQSDLFTSVLYDHYCPPGGFCFDQGCSDPPIMDDPTLFDYNVQERVDAFLKYVQEQSQHYTSNHILIPMGCDFQFENAHLNYKNLDKLISYVNARQSSGSGVNLIYSTPSCYTYAVNQARQTYSWKSDDFFPYADKDHAFWTGYFVSRAALKGFVRLANNRLQAAQQLLVMTGTESTGEAAVDTLRRAMGVLQHHDAVSGTEKQAVAYDYAERLAKGVAAVDAVLSNAINTWLGLLQVDAPLQWSTCDLLNISRCLVTETAQRPVSVVVYNSYSQEDSRYITLPVSCNAQWAVRNLTSGQYLPVQLGLVSQRTASIPERGSSPAACELVLPIDTKALGISSYSVLSDALLANGMKTDRPDAGIGLNPQITPSFAAADLPNDVLYIENEYLRLELDTKTQMSTRLVNKFTQLSITFEHSMRFYYGFQGDNHNGDSQSSGAYVFRPTNNASISGTPTIGTILKGVLFQEVNIDFAPWMTARYRLYRGERHLEIEWTVGPIPDDNKLGREVIMNYQTDLNTNGYFRTDANGRQMLLRQRNVRPAVQAFNQTEEVAGNYYPVNNRIEITSSEQFASLMVLNDRSQGGGSIRDGQIELMVHRRTLHDDSYGVGEPLKEAGSDGKGLIVRGKHFILLEQPTEMEKRHPVMAQKVFHQPTLLFSSSALPVGAVVQKSGLNAPLSANLHIATVDNWRGKNKLLRIEHIGVTNRSEVLTLDRLFADFNITDTMEVTLAANQYVKDSQRLVWLTKDGKSTTKTMPQHQPTLAPVLTLAPMEIVSLEISISR